MLSYAFQANKYANVVDRTTYMVQKERKIKVETRSLRFIYLHRSSAFAV